MTYGLTLVTAPTVEPLSLQEAKNQCHVVGNDHDAILEHLIVSARRVCEDRLSRQLITATWDLVMDEFPADQICLPLPPVQSVTSITYTDTAGSSATWDSSKYTFSASREPARIMPAYNENFPTDVREQPDAVTVRFVAGYGDAATDVPDQIKHAMLLLISHWFENREDVVVGTNMIQIAQGSDYLLDSVDPGHWFHEIG